MRRRKTRAWSFEALESIRLCSGGLEAASEMSADERPAVMGMGVGDEPFGPFTPDGGDASWGGSPPGTGPIDPPDVTTLGMGDGDAALALVPTAEATNVAIASGNWSDPNTWLGHLVPGPGAQVWVMPDITVTV